MYYNNRTPLITVFITLTGSSCINYYYYDDDDDDDYYYYYQCGLRDVM